MSYAKDTLARAFIGFEQAFAEAQSNYPPHNIERFQDGSYRLVIAVAGFDKEDLSVTVDNGYLIVSGQNPTTSVPGNEGEYLHRGIASRNFSRRFHIADVDIKFAELKNGLLYIGIYPRNEDRQGKRIEIK